MQLFVISRTAKTVVTRLLVVCEGLLKVFKCVFLAGGGVTKGY